MAAISDRDKLRMIQNAIARGDTTSLLTLARDLERDLNAKLTKRPSKAPKGDEWKTAAEFWIEGQEPPTSHTKKPTRKTEGAYSPILVTFEDGSTVRGGTYDVDDLGNPQVDAAVRWARALRMRQEFEKREAEARKRYEMAAPYSEAKALASTENVSGWTWVENPGGWRCTRVCAIPDVVSVELIEEETDTLKLLRAPRLEALEAA